MAPLREALQLVAERRARGGQAAFKGVPGERRRGGGRGISGVAAAELVAEAALERFQLPDALNARRVAVEKLVVVVVVVVVVVAVAVAVVVVVGGGDGVAPSSFHAPIPIPKPIPAPASSFLDLPLEAEASHEGPVAGGVQRRGRGLEERGRRLA